MRSCTPGRGILKKANSAAEIACFTYMQDPFSVVTVNAMDGFRVSIID
jgi:hypothetical protein